MTRDASAPENPLISETTDDVDAAHAEALESGHESVHPLTDEPWGVRRVFVGAPDGTVIDVVRHREQHRPDPIDARLTGRSSPPR